ncbi:hypothetical protein [Lentimonas sp. CC10]|uniref:hypothetical protein n=1 Tax=Lentimonas sp. CC10 TaxID=2676095 RepID=UPI00132A1CFA|nr:hypothetical protein [Lentimonas sp. CC10]CAA6689480.1 Unannotated [Lentimonas sp. CC10]CAA6692006.1 Unannotated [Lentimonas sp. CC19]CAA7070533.1 Unannotated [Lentimonas sp. CC11]
MPRNTQFPDKRSTAPTTKSRFFHVFASFLLFVLAPPTTTQAGWESRNPGGGGQVQGIHFDASPTGPGKLFFSSDMEGTSISSDYGATWNPTGARQQNHLMKWVTAVDPQDGDRVYSVGLGGLDISDDGGLTWRYDPTFGEGKAIAAIAAIAIDPVDTNRIYIGNGWANKTRNQLREVDQNEEGPYTMAYSLDRGATWTFSTYTSGAGPRNTFDIEVDPSNGDIYLSSEAGLFRGAVSGQTLTWSPIASPAQAPDTPSAQSQGVCLAGNAQFVIASFETSTDNYAIFAARKSDLGSAASTWTQLSGFDGEIGPDAQCWRPRTDPRDTGNTFHLLVGGISQGNRGLFEAELEWDTTETTFALLQPWTKIFNKTPGTEWNYDHGWKGTNAVCRNYGYTPANWARQTWVSSDEGLYALDDGDHYLTGWQPMWTEAVGDGTYRSRGVVSTFNWDMVGKASFVAQGQADNGLVTSFDGGATWKREGPNGLNDNRSLVLAEVTGHGADDGHYLIAGGSGAYGGGVSWAVGSVYARRLNSDLSGWDGDWVTIGGGNTGLNGMIHNWNGEQARGSRPNSIAADTNDPRVLYVATEKGLYRTTDFLSLMKGVDKQTFQRIGGGDLSIRQVVADPREVGTIYVLQNDGTYRVSNAATASNPTWLKISTIQASGDGTGRAIAAWVPAIDDPLYSAPGAPVYLAVGHQNGDLFLSSDRGDTFDTILDRELILAVHAPELEQWFESDFAIKYGAMAGQGDRLFLTIDSDNRHGYAALKGVIAADGTVAWYDFTDTGVDALLYPRARRGRVFETQGDNYFHIASSGMGLHRRNISEPGLGNGQRIDGNFAGPDSPGESYEPIRTRVLFITRGNPSETYLANQLRALGFEIVLRNVDAGNLTDTYGIDVVFVPGSSSTGGAFRNTSAGLVCATYTDFDDLAFTESGDFGLTSAATVTIQQPEHPTAGGLSGSSIAALTQASNVSWGTPAGASVSVATLPTDTTKALVFAYGTGDAMADDFTAPARRVGFFMRYVNNSLTDQGLTLLAAALIWADPDGEKKRRIDLGLRLKESNTMTFTPPSGRRFVVEYSTDLGQWDPVPSMSDIEGDGNETDLTILAGERENQAEFYRLREVFE